MKIEFILVGVIALVFLVDFFYKKRRRQIETKDITVYKTRKVRSRIKYFAIVGIILIGSVGYFIVYPYLIFTEAEESKKTGSFLKAAELYDKSKSISPVFVKNDSLKFTVISLFCDEIINNINEVNQSNLDTLKYAIDKIDYLKRNDTIHDYIKETDLYIKKIKLLVKYNLISEGKQRGITYNDFRTDNTSEARKTNSSVESLKRLNEKKPDQKVYEFLGKFYFDIKSYETYLLNKKNVTAEDYIEAMTNMYFESLDYDAAIYESFYLQPTDFIVNCFSNLQDHYYDSSDPRILLIKSYLNTQRELGKLKKSEIALDEFEISSYLSSTKPKTLQDILIYIELVHHLKSFSFDGTEILYERRHLSYYTKAIELLNDIKNSNLKSEFISIYGRKDFDLYFYQNFVNYTTTIADIKQFMNLNKQVVYDLDEALTFLLSLDSNSYEDFNKDIASLYRYISISKWNIKPYGPKLGYCDDLEKSLMYYLKDNPNSVWIDAINEKIQKDCN